MSAQLLEIVLDLPCDHVAAAVARRRLGRDLTGRLNPQQFSDLKVVVSELVTNAVIHGHGGIRLRILVTGEDVKGEIIDEDGGLEHDGRDVGVDQLQGHALLFVQRLTSRWGVHKGTTWFEMSPAAEQRYRRLAPAVRPPDAAAAARAALTTGDLNNPSPGSRDRAGPVDEPLVRPPAATAVGDLGTSRT